MPVYDYRCDHCDHAFSATGGFNDPPVKVCPRCGKEPRRLIVATAVVFKGSGWYKTDSRPAQKDASAPAPASTAKDGTGDAAAKPAGGDKGGGDKTGGDKTGGGDTGGVGKAAGDTAGGKKAPKADAAST